MNLMWRILRKLGGGDAKAEAEVAVQEAARSLQIAESQTARIELLAERVNGHGRRNHFGERIEAAARRAYP